jgi:hypothetical protein
LRALGWAALVELTEKDSCGLAVLVPGAPDLADQLWGRAYEAWEDHNNGLANILHLLASNLARLAEDVRQLSEDVDEHAAALAALLGHLKHQLRDLANYWEFAAL